MFTTLILSLLPAAVAQADLRYAEITVEKSAIRSFYDNKSAVVLEVDQGFPVQVVAELVPWSKVRVPGGFDVWVHKDFVIFDGADGTITSNRVRIRPLPSTATESHPLGHFSKGDSVTRLLADGDWVKVRYNDQVAAWIETKDLVFPERELSQWQRIWSDFAETRAPLPSPEIIVAEEEGESSVEEVVATDQPTPTADLQDSTTGAQDGVVESSSGRALQGVAAPASWEPFGAAQVAIEPAKHRALADVQLRILGAAVTKSNDNWDRQRLDNLEMVYGNVIWHCTDRKEVDAARSSLLKIDGLRRFYCASLASEARRAEIAGDKIHAASLHKLREDERKPRLVEDQGTTVEVGWVEYHPKVNARIPFKVVRGDRAIPLHSYDGHQKLQEFVNHEIVVRGTWRADKTVQGEWVLAITELRVLPIRRK